VKVAPEPDLPTLGPEADWIKGILPEAVKGAWWERPPDGQGYRLKLRWRGAKSDGPHEGKRPPKHSYVFCIQAPGKARSRQAEGDDI
jgi:hypothetical protein